MFQIQKYGKIVESGLNIKSVKSLSQRTHKVSQRNGFSDIFRY